MTEITARMTALPLILHRADVSTIADRNAFVASYEIGMDYLSQNTIGEFNTIINQLNVFSTEAYGIGQSIGADADLVQGYRNDTLTYRNDAISAKNAIDGYVIPTEATLSADAINALDETHRLEIFLGFNF